MWVLFSSFVCCTSSLLLLSDRVCDSLYRVLFPYMSFLLSFMYLCPRYASCVGILVFLFRYLYLPMYLCGVYLFIPIQLLCFYCIILSMCFSFSFSGYSSSHLFSIFQFKFIVTFFLVVLNSSLWMSLWMMSYHVPPLMLVWDSLLRRRVKYHSFRCVMFLVLISPTFSIFIDI